MYGSSFRIETWRPRALSNRPMLAAVMPFPREEVTPPVTKTYFATGQVLRGFFECYRKVVPEARRIRGRGRAPIVRRTLQRTVEPPATPLQTTKSSVRRSDHASGATTDGWRAGRTSVGASGAMGPASDAGRRRPQRLRNPSPPRVIRTP